MHPELDAARAGVVAVGLVAHADVAEQAGKQRAVDGAVAFGLLRVDRSKLPVELLEGLLQLDVDVAPFAHARESRGNSRGRSSSSLPSNTFHSLR